MVEIGEGVYIDPTAVIIGDVTLGDGVSVWPLAVIRGDQNSIYIDAGSNVQDHAIIHVDYDHHVYIGKNVTVGHAAVVHGATVGDNCLIGINATVLNGVEIGAGSFVAAGSVVRQGATVPPNSLVAGVPATVKRTDPRFRETIFKNAQMYHGLRDRYLAGQHVHHRR
jgi:carbonic anhydrase/acetyltransferase-like protein (isoleucine patch superfamily)